MACHLAFYPPSRLPKGIHNPLSLLGLPDPIVSRETIHTLHGCRSDRLYPLAPLLQGDPDTSIMSGLLTSVVSRETFQSLLACCSYVRSVSFLILKGSLQFLVNTGLAWLTMFHVKHLSPSWPATLAFYPPVPDHQGTPRSLVVVGPT